MAYAVKTDSSFLERAKELQQASLVIDSLSPKPCSELILSPKYLELVQGLVDEGLSRRALRIEIGTSMLRLIEQDEAFRQELGSLIRRSGVNAMSSTHAGAGPQSTAFAEAVRLIGDTYRLIELMPDVFMPILTPQDLERAHQEQKCGIILNFQNSQPIGDDLARLDTFFNLGIRIIQLTYNLRTLVGDGCTERRDAGLSYFGESLVQRMNDLGIIVDASHCGVATSADAIDVSRTPIAFTHTFARALSDHPRGKTDDQLRAIADRGGYVGVCVVPFFLSDGNSSVSLVADHIRYIADLIGSEHVGIGTDFTRSWELPGHATKQGSREPDWVGWRPEHRYGRRSIVEGLADYGEFSNLTAALLEKGFSSEEVEGILGRNFLNFYQQVWDARQALPV